MGNRAFIEKLTEYAYGFEFRFTGDVGNELITYRHGAKKMSVNWKKVKEWEFYPLLLWRAVYGFNLTDGLTLHTAYDKMYIYDKPRLLKYIKVMDYQPTQYLTPQEQALEAALMEVLC